MGLWTGQPLRSLTRWSLLLGTDVARLRRLLAHVAISPLGYATRAHEILEDAQRDLLSGRDDTLARVQGELGLLGQALSRVRHEHHGSWPTLGQLTPAQHELINNGTLAGALGALQLLPGTLETTPIPTISTIPGHK